jgi:hypothetical protein
MGRSIFKRNSSSNLEIVYEQGDLERLVWYIRVTEQSQGGGVKKAYDSEQFLLKKLRRVNS